MTGGGDNNVGSDDEDAGEMKEKGVNEDRWEKTFKTMIQ